MPAFSDDFWIYMMIGFAAQIVDGALGMAFGVISSTCLLAFGQTPVIVSASVHTAEMVVTAFSAGSHIVFKNVNWKLCLPLAMFGALGGFLGATILVNVDGDAIKPFISIYLALLGLFILWKVVRRKKEPPPPLLPTARLSALGIAGGALDACGGGGWGPIVTTNLIARGDNPRLVIGSVNTAEFIVTTAITLSFIAAVGFQFTDVVIGLLAGGVIAAPLGAFVLRFVPARALMTIVGVLITSLSVWQILKMTL